MQKIWTSEVSYIAPTDFRVALTKFAPQFNGFRQHDSQELLAFLMDGLHEDLNLITKKNRILKLNHMTVDKIMKLLKKHGKII